jgi:hypothetical protein
VVIYQNAILSDRRPRETLSRERTPSTHQFHNSPHAASLFLQLRQLLFETANPIGEIVEGRTFHRLG